MAVMGLTTDILNAVADFSARERVGYGPTRTRGWVTFRHLCIPVSFVDNAKLGSSTCGG